MPSSTAKKRTDRKKPARSAAKAKASKKKSAKPYSSGKTRKVSSRQRSRAGSAKRSASGSASAGGTWLFLLFRIFALLLLFCCAILLISQFGSGGYIGEKVCEVQFGLFGKLSFLLPFLIFFGFLFLASNAKNLLAYKKMAAAIVFYVFSCGLFQIITEGYDPSYTLQEYYDVCSLYHIGGGQVGGAIVMASSLAFGEVGGTAILVLVLLTSLIVITQRSLADFLSRVMDVFSGVLRPTTEEMEFGEEERRIRQEIREQKRLKKLESKHQKRLMKLEQRAMELEREEVLPSAGKSKTVEKEQAEIVRSEKVHSENAKPEKAGPKKAGPEKENQGSEKSFRLGKVKEKLQEAFSIGDIEEFEDWEEEPAEEDRFAPYIHRMGDKDIELVPAGRQESIYDMFDVYQDSHGDLPLPEKKEKKKSASDKTLPDLSAAVEIPVQKNIHYTLPPLELLKEGKQHGGGESDEELRKTAKKLQEIMGNFNVNVTVSDVCCGPTVTRYEIQPEAGVKVSRIVGLTDDIKLNLAAADIRIEAPIPGKAAVGIEVPNKKPVPVLLRDLIQSPEFSKSPSRVSFAVGKDIAGETVVADIAKMPHLLIAGATGAGKSVCINTLIISILYKALPDEVQLIMVDPKVVELSIYNGIPHLLIPVVTDPKKAAGALNWAVAEMEKRYNHFAEYGVRNIGEYNHKISGMKAPEGGETPAHMSQIVIIVDELADLMMTAPQDVEDAIVRLAQKARAAGIHLVIATQRPSVNVITGLIKANMPSRIAFAVSSGVDSRTILDCVGAEKLLGKGDMLFSPQGYPKPARLQGALVTDEEVEAVVDFWKEQNQSRTADPEIEKAVVSAAPVFIGPGASDTEDERDVFFEEAGRFIIEKDRASIGMLQRMFKIGFNRAARIMDQLSEAGVVGPEEGTKPRKILMTKEEFDRYCTQSQMAG